MCFATDPRRFADTLKTHTEISLFDRNKQWNKRRAK